MKTVRKVCAAVLRQGPVGSELLVFEHPSAGVQLPKGGLDAEEDPQEGVLRELHEETGLDLGDGARRIGVWERFAGAGPTESGPLQRHVWEVFLIAAPDGLPDEWFHEAWGSEAELGLRLRCHWVPLEDGCEERLHPLFGPVVAMIQASAAP